MKHKNNLFRFLKIGFVLLLVYIVIAVCHFFVFSDKLTYDELVLVTEYYEEIRPVDKSIKSDFYVDTLLKVLDKKYISEELRKDSLTYSMYVVNKSFELFSESLDAKSTAEYILRCRLDFDNFVGLENSSELFDLSISFFNSSTQQIEDLTTFGEFMDQIVSDEYMYLNEISQNRNNSLIIFISFYFITVIVLYFIDLNRLIKLILFKRCKQGGKK